jgi:hypothetical protein
VAAADEPTADRGEVGLAIGAHVHQLAVKHDPMTAQRRSNLGELGELGTAVAARARAQRPPAASVRRAAGRAGRAI